MKVFCERYGASRRLFSPRLAASAVPLTLGLQHNWRRAGKIKAEGSADRAQESEANDSKSVPLSPDSLSPCRLTPAPFPPVPHADWRPSRSEI